MGQYFHGKFLTTLDIGVDEVDEQDVLVEYEIENGERRSWDYPGSYPTCCWQGWLSLFDGREKGRELTEEEYKKFNEDVEHECFEDLGLSLIGPLR